MEDEILTTIQRVVRDLFEDPNLEVDEDELLEDLGFTDMELSELIEELLKELGVVIDDQEIEMCLTILDVVELVQAKVDF
jgi:acyl carrier protein